MNGLATCPLPTGSYGAEWIQLIQRQLSSVHSDILVVPRELPFDFQRQILQAPVSEQRTRVACSAALTTALDCLHRMQIDLPELSEDIAQNVRLFGQLIEQEHVELRLELTDQQSCPKFHCDNVYIRMLTTYAGPCTQYIDRDHPETIHQATLNALVFLKGHQHPTYQDHMLHRSPAMLPGQKRLCLILNRDRWLAR